MKTLVATEVEDGAFETVFYVYVEGDRSLSVPYSDREKAWAEAARRARGNPGRRAYLLEAIGAMRVADPRMVAQLPRPRRVDVRA